MVTPEEQKTNGISFNEQRLLNYQKRLNHFPMMPFGRHKDFPMTNHSKKSLLYWYINGDFNDYPECKEWIEDNLL